MASAGQAAPTRAPPGTLPRLNEDVAPRGRPRTPASVRLRRAHHLGVVGASRRAFGVSAASAIPVLDTLAAMIIDSLERCGLSPDTLILTRLAALAASDAPPVSYLTHVDARARPRAQGRSDRRSGTGRPGRPHPHRGHGPRDDGSGHPRHSGGHRHRGGRRRDRGRDRRRDRGRELKGNDPQRSSCASRDWVGPYRRSHGTKGQGRKAGAAGPLGGSHGCPVEDIGLTGTCPSSSMCGRPPTAARAGAP